MKIADGEILTLDRMVMTQHKMEIQKLLGAFLSISRVFLTALSDVNCNYPFMSIKCAKVYILAQEYQIIKSLPLIITPLLWRIETRMLSSRVIRKRKKTSVRFLFEHPLY